MSEFNPTPEFEEQIRRAVAVPDADPEFVQKLQTELARRPVKTHPRFALKPAWAFAFVLAAILMIAATPAAVNALKRLLGYVPNVGLVENTGNLRMLAEPVSVTRDGVTLSISSAFVYEDHVELIYDVQGIPAENNGWDPVNSNEDPKLFCGGVVPGDPPPTEGNAVLRLPDGTLLERDGTGKYPQDQFAMKPVYEAKVPADVTGLTLVLGCVPEARRGAVPENWEVPFKLVRVPEGTVVGNPVIDVNAASEPVATATMSSAPSVSAAVPAAPNLPVIMKVERIVPLESGTLYYISLNLGTPDPSLISLMPVSAYLLDSQGQKIELRGNYVWQPFEHRVGSQFEFLAQTSPAEGPVTVVVDNAVAVYAPMYTDPPQATPDEMSFTFNVGKNPAPGQTWELNKEFNVAGYPVKVHSAQATTYAELKAKYPDMYDSQGFEYGFDFLVDGSPSQKVQVEMDIISESPVCAPMNLTPLVPVTSSQRYTILCRETFPTGDVRVNIRELSVFVENTWQAVLNP